MSDNTTPNEIDLIEAGEEERLLSQGEDPASLPADDTSALPSPTPPLSLAYEPEPTSQASSLHALEGVIRRQSVRLDELRAEVKTLNDQLRSILDNDEELSKAEEEVKVAARKQKERKTALASNAESMQIKFKLKDIKESIKDLEDSLSNHLLNLFQVTGVKEFDTDDGGKREYDVKAKLRGKKKQE